MIAPQDIFTGKDSASDRICTVRAAPQIAIPAKAGIHSSACSVYRTMDPGLRRDGNVNIEL
jgi:hypothetical protein